jgi:1,2-diacylglycerol 3-beta-galactosyltransferase
MTEPQHRNILILTADAGFGHRSAANAVAAALEHTYSDRVTVNIVNPLDDPRALSVLRNAESDYDRLARDWPRFYEFGYKMSDLAMTTSVTETAYIVLMYDIISGLMKQHQPDAVVITFPTYQSTFEAYRRISGNRIPMATIVTDLISLQRMWFHKATDLCLVPTQVAADLAVERGLDPTSVHITGLPVNPVLADRPASKAEARAALGWLPDKPTLLAVGSKRVERLDEFLHVLNHAAFDIQIVAVAGGNDELYARLAATDWHVPAKTYNFVTNMPDFLHAADAVMSKAGGLIVTESLACGLPLLITQIIPGQETGNAELVTREGAGDVTLEPLALLETMAHWLKDDRRLFELRAANARRLGKPRAAYDAADLIWGLAVSGPVAPHARFPFKIDSLKELLRQFGPAG